MGRVTTGTRPDAATEPAGGRHRRRGGFFSELPGLLLLAFLLALLLKAFVVQAFYIPSMSMEPTLAVGERVLVNKLAFLFGGPERGAVVVFSDETGPAGQPRGFLGRVGELFASGLGLPTSGERDFIKRIIGLPGDVVELRDGVVFVNGAPLPESAGGDGGYLTSGDLSDYGPVIVGEGRYFMLGDNRPNSADSRFGLGQIARDDVVGRAFMVVWPFGGAGTLPIPDYAPAPPADPAPELLEAASSDADGPVVEPDGAITVGGQRS